MALRFASARLEPILEYAKMEYLNGTVGVLMSRVAMLALLLVPFAASAATGVEGGEKVVKPRNAAARDAKAQTVDLAALTEALVQLNLKAKGCDSTRADEMELVATRANGAMLIARAQGGTSVDAMAAKFEVINQKTAAGWDYDKCKSDAKNAGETNIAEKVRGIRDSASRVQYAAALAQVLTAIDSIGKKNADEELSKADTQINLLKISYPSK